MAAFDDPLGGLPPAEWAGVAANRLYSSPEWLGLLAQDGSRAGAVHGRTAAGGVAAVPVTVVRDEPNPFYRWHDELAARGLPAPAPDGVLVGPRRGHQTHLLMAPGTDPVAAAGAVLSGLRELDGVASRAPRVAMYLDTAGVLAMRAAGARALPVLLRPDAWIPVPDGDWHTWLASLPGRRRAELVRREVRRFTAAGYEVTDRPLAEWTDVVGRLLTNTEAKYGHSAEPAGRIAFLRRQAARLGPAARVLLCAPPGEPPVGYCLYYLWGDTLFLRSAGFDYPRLRGAAEYFNLVYYLPVRIAAAAGARWVHAGVEAAEAKALRGAQLRPSWLLDLSADSVLAGQADAIRAVNARLAAEIVDSGPAVRAAWRPEPELTAHDVGVPRGGGPAVTGSPAPEFGKVWLSQALTLTATKSLSVVLPLVAVVSFDAGPAEVGFVNAAQTVPVFLFTLLAGAWLDNHARRPNLLVAHGVRGGALLAVPLLAFTDVSGVWRLGVVAFVVGALTALADVTYPVYVPSLVGPDRLVAANSRLEVVNSITQVAAPGLGGLVVGLLGGDRSIVLISVLYLGGGVAVLLVRAPEHVTRAPGAARRLLPDTAVGVRVLARQPMLRLLAAEAAWFNLFEQAVVTVYLVFAVRTLHLSPVALGTSMGIGALGAVLGSGFARRLGRVVGMRGVLIGGMAAASAAPALIPLAAGSPAPVVVAGLSFVLYGFGLSVFNVFSVSMRQRITPPELLGRVTATFRFVAFGTIWIGALVGGGLGGWLGLEPALWISVAALVGGWAVFAARFRALLRTTPALRAQTESLTGREGEHR